MIRRLAEELGPASISSRFLLIVMVFCVFGLDLAGGAGASLPFAWASPQNDSTSRMSEFSARLIWKKGGKTSKAQLFVKGDRYRIEHFGGVATGLGYAGVTIVRLDAEKVWYLFSQRRLLLSVPLTADYLLPFSVELKGEVGRTLIGDAEAGGRPARLYEVEVINSQGDKEAYFEWVDAERGVLLKLLSQDRDWSVEYEHVVLSSQPDYYFEAPLGYRKVEGSDVRVPQRPAG